MTPLAVASMIEGTPYRRLVVYPKRTKLMLLFLGSLGFVVAGIWIWTLGEAGRLAGWRVIVSAYVGVPFFASAAIYLGSRLIKRSPSLVIDEGGITDAASAVGGGRLTWNEIDYVMPYEFGGQSMLGVMPVDIDELIARQGWIRGRLMKANMGLGTPPVNIPESALPMTVLELAQLLGSRYGVRVATPD